MMFGPAHAIGHAGRGNLPLRDARNEHTPQAKWMLSCSFHIVCKQLAGQYSTVQYSYVKESCWLEVGTTGGGASYIYTYMLIGSVCWW